jgi:hypothetical protein
VCQRGIADQFLKLHVVIFQEGITLSDIYNEAKAILENDDAFGSSRFFLEALLATAEYDTFYTLMRNEMVSNRQLK